MGPISYPTPLVRASMTIIELIPIITPWMLFVGSLVVGVIGWTLKRVVSELDEHGKDIDSLAKAAADDRLRIAQEYVRHDALREMRTEMRSDMARIEGKLDQLIREQRA